MKRIVLYVAAALLFAFTAANANDIVIQTDCVHLNDLLGDRYPVVAVQCGLMPGDTKALTSNIVAAALKRNGLPMVQMPPAFQVSRAGRKLTEESLLHEINAMYTEKYPDRDVRVESIRFGREIFIPENTEYTLSIDLSRFGSVSASLSAGNVRTGFSYTVRIYDTGFIATDRIAAGEEIDDKLMPETIDITNLRGTLVKDPSDVIAVRTITRGKVLTADLVEQKPERKKGDPVVLIYAKGPIRLEITAIAEGNAVVGKSFPVRNPTSGIIFTAIYEGDGIAMVY